MAIKLNSDTVSLGFILGILAPALAFLAYYEIKFPNMSTEEFLNYLSSSKTSSSLTSLCVLANLLVFYIFIQTEKYLSARGVLLSTFIYAGIIVYLRFFTPSL